MIKNQTFVDQPLPDYKKIMLKAKKGDDLTQYGIIEAKCPFCDKLFVVHNPYNSRWPPINIIKLRCGTHSINYNVKITKLKLRVIEESVEVVPDV